MSFRLPRWWRVPFAGVAIAYLFLMYEAGAPPTHENLVRATADGVLVHEPDEISDISVQINGARQSFSKTSKIWAYASSGEPVEQAKQRQIIEALKLLHNAPPVRVIAPEEIASIDREAYGLAQPRLTLNLLRKGTSVMTASFGNRANDGIVQYMQLDGDDAIYLMSGFVGDAWQALKP